LVKPHHFFSEIAEKRYNHVVMSFPETHETLVYRVATKGSERDWYQFLSDYWLPVCRFAQRRGQVGVQDAEDIAVETFEAILRNQLLQRWILNRSSKLRTLLCTVIRQVLSNRARVQKRRQQLLKEKRHELLWRTDLLTIKVAYEGVEHMDEFYAAWVESILLQVLESLMEEYKSKDRVEYFRVLHGRICERMTAAQISKAVGIKIDDVQNYYRAARKRLASKLKELTREHVHRYCSTQDVNTEFDSEWRQLGQYLKEHGGLEHAIGEVYGASGLLEMASRRAQVVTSTACRLAQEVPKLREFSVKKLQRTREQRRK
jgi:RNA polymerase sigma factor (sigma-70 family)